MSSPQEKELLQVLEELNRRKRERFIDTLFPDTGPLRRELYSKHIEFMNAGSTFRQRAFIAANRVGKTLSAGCELVYHCTGQYPHWWKGKVFKKPINAWVVTITNDMLRSSIQELLFGVNEEEWGTGLIPKSEMLDMNGHFYVTRMAGVPGCISNVLIKHYTNGIFDGYSKVEFKTYEQGWQKFQAANRDLIWLDEDSGDGKIYTECLTRTMTTLGHIICTFTPLLGISDTVLQFLPESMMPENGVHPDGYKFAVCCSWDDVPHLTEQAKRELVQSYPEHERPARTQGIVYLGAGAIFPYMPDTYVVSPFKIPAWWPRWYGMDVGWNNTSATFFAIDPDTNRIYQYAEYVGKQGLPAVHASAIKSLAGDWMIGAIDPASRQTGVGNGEETIEIYRREGLRLVVADNAVEPGIMVMKQLLETGMWKIFSTCTNTLKEMKLYRRDDAGKVVKKDDHCIDANKYALRTGIDYGQIKPEGQERFSQLYSKLAKQGASEVTGY